MRIRDLEKHKGEEVVVLDDDDTPLQGMQHLVGRHCRLLGSANNDDALVLFKGRQYKLPAARIDFTPDGA